MKLVYYLFVIIHITISLKYHDVYAPKRKFQMSTSMSLGNPPEQFDLRRARIAVDYGPRLIGCCCLNI
jgi:hypothetical protein